MAEMTVCPVSSLRVTFIVGSASQLFSRKLNSLSSVPRLSGSMATWYRELGKRNAAASTLPVTDSVSPAMAEILGTTTMSPAMALWTSVMSRPTIR